MTEDQKAQLRHCANSLSTVFTCLDRLALRLELSRDTKAAQTVREAAAQVDISIMRVQALLAEPANEVPA